MINDIHKGEIKMKKIRITALLLGVVMLLGASGCSSAEKETEAVNTVTADHTAADADVPHRTRTRRYTQAGTGTQAPQAQRALCFNTERGHTSRRTV